MLVIENITLITKRETGYKYTIFMKHKPCIYTPYSRFLELRPKFSWIDMWPEEEKKQCNCWGISCEAEIYKWSRDLQVEQWFTSGAEIYKWSRHLQVEQKFTSGAMIYKWSRDLQVAQTFTSGAEIYKWSRDVQALPDCTYSVWRNFRFIILLKK